MSYPVFLCPASGLLFNSLQVQGDLLDNTATFAINYVIRCPVSGHVLHFFVFFYLNATALSTLQMYIYQ